MEAKCPITTEGSHQFGFREDEYHVLRFIQGVVYLLGFVLFQQVPTSDVVMASRTGSVVVVRSLL